jgi:NAD(P)H dehydrogenase (quinone)
MRILVVFAHPRRGSFNGAVLDALVEGLREADHEPDVADLYAEDFDPRLGAEELPRMGSGHPPAEVAAYQRRLLAAEGLAFVFPVWWFGPPAILKGFVDRVFEENVAFRFNGAGWAEGLLPARQALLLSTTGASGALYRTLRLAGPMHKTLGLWTLRACGVQQVRQELFHEVVTTDDAARKRYLERAWKLGRTYFGG